MKPKKMLKELDVIDYAFQPIVTPSGTTIGVEALIRNTDKLGFKSINDFFDYLSEEKILFDGEYILRKKAFSKYSHSPLKNRIKLFYNYDHRILDMPNYENQMMEKLLKEEGINLDILCIEATEKVEHTVNSANLKVYTRAKKSGINFALDDFGVAFSNLQLLYFIEPNFIKIDKFFVRDIDQDSKKRFFCQKIIEISHTIGAKVVAEGVETVKEYFTLKSLGVDALQGFLISKPTLNVHEIHEIYGEIKIMAESEKRSVENIDVALIQNEIERVEPLSINDEIVKIFIRLKEAKNVDYIPVVDSSYSPIGIITEKDLREFTYSPFGRDLLSNSAFHTSIGEFVRNVGICDIKDPVSKILEVYSNYLGSEGIIIKDEFKYVGFLDSKSIIKIINEKKILEARDLNPLTKLPGNASVADQIKRITSPKESYDYLIYYDFNNFKPFNDKFGFRVGDRAILGFSEIIQKFEPVNFKKTFTGHIGGDDFIQVITSNNQCVECVLNYISCVLEEFKNFVFNFHSEDDKKNGYYVSKDRYGKKRKFSFLDSCGAVIEIPPLKNPMDEIAFSNVTSQVKKLSKEHPSKVSAVSILPQ